jgi:NAD(P)H-dependent FMN reductase
MRIEGLDSGSIHPSTLLGICASLKPGPGQEGKSASRSLLLYALETIRAVYPHVALFDLRQNPVPLFDGRLPEEYEDAHVKFSMSCVASAGALLLSVPAYWSGVSGVFKNFVDVICGASYKKPASAETIFAGKPVGLLVVGSDRQSGFAGADQASTIMKSTGAVLVAKPVVISDLHASNLDTDNLSAELIALGGELARHAYLNRVRL